MNDTRHDLPCSNCGAQLTYSPGAGSMECPFCGTVNELPQPDEGAVDATDIRELDYERGLADLLDHQDVEETQTLSCPGCGAEVTFDASTVADECPFCATSLAKEVTHSHRHPKPQGVLPFAITEADARGRMKSWLGGLWFAPSGLSRFAEAGRPIAGTYLPHYTYDALGTADYRGQRGDAYYVNRTRTVMVDGKAKRQNYRERRIRWRRVSGRVRRAFDDVLVPASDTLGPMNDGVEAGGRSWDLSALEPYRTEYLAGFRAEAPALHLRDGFGRAQQTMNSMLARDVRFDIGGDAQRIDHMSSDFRDITFKHILLPVWLAAYRYRNKPYRVVINGRTGAVSGERPYSAWKIAVAVVLGLIVAVAIAYVLIQAEAGGNIQFQVR